MATWNLTTREFTVDEQGNYFVDGEPLGFYHFTGFDSGAHRIMATKNAGENSDVHKLINWYDDQTKNLAQDPLAKVSWAYGLHSDGSPISKAQRLVYRERLDLQKAFLRRLMQTLITNGGYSKARKSTLNYSLITIKMMLCVNSALCLLLDSVAVVPSLIKSVLWVSLNALFPTPVPVSLLVRKDGKC
ncbi:hypothetical protein [Edwardsiella tarda]|uniref:hypothetical protein n=1 Tax=Edwardsiella tarda TaxID=636 RepID=UPI00351C4EDF